MSCACLGPRHFHYQCRASDIAEVGTTLNVFSYDAFWAGRIEAKFEHRTHNLPVLSGCAACYATDSGDYLYFSVTLYKFYVNLKRIKNLVSCLRGYLFPFINTGTGTINAVRPIYMFVLHVYSSSKNILYPLPLQKKLYLVGYIPHPLPP